MGGGVIIYSIFIEKLVLMSINNEAVSLLTITLLPPLFYLCLVNFFILIIVLECQNLVFLYLVVVFQIMGRNVGLRQLWALVSVKLKQKLLWQLSTLFIQFWGMFFSGICLIYCSVRLGELDGTVGWVDLSYMGYWVGSVKFYTHG